MHNFIDVHNVEYGECIVVSPDFEHILIVDCGSMNTKMKFSDISFKQYVQKFVVQRYQDVKNKNFLLTHFHKDHICGLYEILSSEKNFFDNVYLPQVVTDADNRPFLLEAALYESIFLQRNSCKSVIGSSMIKIFSYLKDTIGIGRFFTVSRGDVFDVGAQKYEVLWPIKDDFEFSDILIESVNLANDCVGAHFLKLKDQFVDEYINCSNLCSVSTVESTTRICKSISKLERLISEIEDLIPSLQRTSFCGRIRALFDNEHVNSNYSADQNAQSVVFHSQDLLMTGDATPDVFEKIRLDLLDRYRVFKAPHHGTASSWSDVFNDFSRQHTLISNGDYHAAGKIFKKYFLDDSIKHCSNKNVCDYYRENGDCCNRLKICSENKSFVFKCKNFKDVKGPSNCGIYVLDSFGDNGCMH